MRVWFWKWRGHLLIMAAMLVFVVYSVYELLPDDCNSGMNVEDNLPGFGGE